MDKTTKDGSFRMFQGLGQEPDNKMQLKHEKENFMRTAIRTIMLVTVIATICCMAGCRSSDEDTAPAESTGNPMSSQSFTTQFERQEEVSPEGSVSSSIDFKASVSKEEEAVIITPNESLPNGDIPQPDGRPEIDVPGSNQAYEAGKITLSLDDAQEIVITDVTAKTTILGYVDSMKESSYNAENTPPAMGGSSVTVTVHRDNGIEQYIFTEMNAEGNSLGKDLQGDTFMWTITDSQALPYLINLFS